MVNHGKYVFTLDEDTRKYCELNLNETDQVRENALETLKLWAEANPHLHVKSDDFSLLPFLRGCKFNIQRTQEKLVNYYTMRRDAPEWFSNRNPLLSEIQELVKLGVFIPLKQNHNNQLIVIIRTGAHNPKRHQQNDVFKTGKMLLDVASMDNEHAQIYGVTAIFDMKNVSLGHASQLTPAIIKKAVFSWQNYHCRPKRLEFVNAPTYINVMLSIFKGFMSSKLQSRIQIHYNGLEALHSIVPKSILPEEYGGEQGPLDDLLAYWQQKLLAHSAWFQEDELYKAESLASFS